MSKLILFIVLSTFQAWNLTWGSSYRLYLRNGNELRTSHYWNEGDEVRFYIYGGVAGIQKGLISSIIKLNSNYKEDEAYEEDLEEIHGPSQFSGTRETEIARNKINEMQDKLGGNTGKKEVVDFDDYKERKAALKEKLDDALQRNRESITRQDQEDQEITRKEYLELSKQIIDLGEELKRKNEGVLPGWWQE